MSNSSRNKCFQREIESFIIAIGNRVVHFLPHKHLFPVPSSSRRTSISRSPPSDIPRQVDVLSRRKRPDCFVSTIRETRFSLHKRIRPTLMARVSEKIAFSLIARNALAERLEVLQARCVHRPTHIVRFFPRKRTGGKSSIGSPSDSLLEAISTGRGGTCPPLCSPPFFFFIRATHFPYASQVH